MGWLFGWDSRKALISHLLDNFGSWSGTNETTGVTSSHKMIAHCFKGNNMWFVIETTHTKDGTSDTHRWIGLNLMQRGGHPAEWGYKDISEEMGPCECNCPLAYLELAPLSEHNQDRYGWRNKVRAYWAQREKGRELAAKLVRGQEFISGYGNRYYFIEHGHYSQKGYVIGENAAGHRYRIKNEEVRVDETCAPPPPCYVGAEVKV